MAARGGDRASSVMARDPRIPIAGHERRSARQLMADAWTALQDSGKIVAPRRTRGRPPSNLRAVGQNHQGSARPRDAIRARIVKPLITPLSTSKATEVLCELFPQLCYRHAGSQAHQPQAFLLIESKTSNAKPHQPTCKRQNGV